MKALLFDIPLTDASNELYLFYWNVAQKQGNVCNVKKCQMIVKVAQRALKHRSNCPYLNVWFHNFPR